MTRVKVGSICLNSTTDFENNIANAERLVREAALQKCDWIVLPEVFPYIGPDTSTFDIYKNIHKSVNDKMSLLAKELSVTLFAGTIPRPASEGQKLLNILSVFGPSGQLLGEYEKTHLFELRGEDGQITVSETRVYQAGPSPRTLMIDGLHVGLAICYDVRFLPLFESM